MFVIGFFDYLMFYYLDMMNELNETKWNAMSDNYTLKIKVWHFKNYKNFNKNNSLLKSLTLLLSVYYSVKLLYFLLYFFINYLFFLPRDYERNVMKWNNLKVYYLKYQILNIKTVILNS